MHEERFDRSMEIGVRYARVGVLIVAAVALVLASGCRDRPDPTVEPAASDWTVLGLDVRIDAHDTRHVVPTDGQAFGQQVTAAVHARQGWTDRPGGVAARGELDLVVYDVPRGSDVAVVASIRLRDDTGAMRFEAEVRDRVAGPAWDEDPASHVEAVAGALADDLEWLVGIDRRDAEVVVQALSQAEGDVYAAALDALDASPDADALPLLLRRLGELNTTDYVRTVGALAQIGDPSAVSPIIDALDLEDADAVLAVLPALARFDGAETAGFIAALASGHDDARVRLHATRALERVRP